MLKHFFSLLFLLIFISTSELPAQAPKEIRAVWFTTLKNLDWPSRPAHTAEGAAAQKAELIARFDELQRAGINVILFQARLRATTTYASTIEPWAEVMTGKLGRAPMFDPLAFAIEEAHKRGMELHAWMVAFPAMKVAEARALGKAALPARHPHLVMRADDGWMLNPGVPETADYLASLCAEVVERYDVDGIHLDYIRYPERGIAFNDDATYKRYGRGVPKDQWRRENVTRVVRTVHEAVRRRKPWVKLSCSPVGKYADVTRYKAGGWNARDAVSQEAQTWQQEGWMDWLFPMMYFEKDHFFPFAADWVEASGGKPVVPGLGIYFLSPREKNWALTTITREMHYLRQIGARGQAYFRSRFLTDNHKDLYRFMADEFYRTPAVVPPITWVDSIPPAAPALSAVRAGRTLRLAWSVPADAHTYNLYRADSATAPLTAYRLIARRIDGATSYSYAPALPRLLHGAFRITAVDRYGNESRLSTPAVCQ